MLLLEADLSWQMIPIDSIVNSIMSLCSQHPSHLLIEFILGIFVVFFLKKKFKKTKKTPQLTEQEVETLIRNWTPAPLHQELTQLQKLNIEVPIVSSSPSSYLVVNGKSALNLSTSNYLGLVQHHNVQKAADAALHKYGCGSCGPRGFYGTIDIHITLEQRLAEFFGCEEAIIYSSGFATLSSVIPTFSKKDDVIFCDSGINFALKTGIFLSRSTTKWFRHNDVDHLQALLEEVQREDLATKRKLTRRFLVVEGLYQYYGDIVPLDKIMELKKKYCFRIILDDSQGIGVLGTTGRGTPQHFGIPCSEIEFIVSSMGNSLASVGGFCCGSKVIVDHQRLNSSGYVFSASLPPYLAAASIQALNVIHENPNLIVALQNKAKLFREALSDIEGLTVCGDEISPIIHLRYNAANPQNDRFSAEVLLQTIVDKALEENIALTRAKYVNSEEGIPAPSIAVTVMASHDTRDLMDAAQKIKSITKQVLNDSPKCL